MAYDMGMDDAELMAAMNEVQEIEALLTELLGTGLRRIELLTLSMAFSPSPIYPRHKWEGIQDPARGRQTNLTYPYILTHTHAHKPV